MSDSIIYEAQPIPPEDPNDRSRKQRTSVLGAIGLVVVLLVAIALGTAIFSGSEQDPLADDAVPTVTQPPTRDDRSTTTVPGLQNRSFGSEDSQGGYSIAPRGPRGEPTAPLPAIEFDWQRVVLDLSNETNVYIQQVTAVGDGFVALGMSFNNQEGTEQAITWFSDDGLNWTRQDLNGDFANANVWQFSFNEHGGIAIGDSWEGGDFVGGDVYEGYGSTSVVWTSADGSTWQRSEFSRDLDSNEHLYLNTGVAGPNGYVVFGTVEQSPNYPPIEIEKDGLILQLSNQNNTYKVFDPINPGIVLASGSQEEIYRYNEVSEGQGIYDPETNDLIVVVPYETWEQAFADAYEQVGNGPFGQYGYEPVDVVIEYDGYRITVSQETSFVVENIGTGEVIASGSAETLWQGPPPEISDANGNVLMSFSWDEFYMAQEAHWQAFEEPFGYSMETVVHFSADGVNWESRSLGTGAMEGSVESVGLTDNGFVAIGYRYDEFGEARQVLESSNGLDWTVVAELEQYLWNMTQGPNGRLLAFGDSSNGQGIWASEDGVNGGTNWSEAFPARVPEDETAYEWFNQLSSGGLGTVVVGSREINSSGTERPEPLTITQGDYTLTFDDYDWPPRVTVIDNVTGDAVIDVSLSEEEEVGYTLPEGFFYEDGVTIIENNNIVLLTITDEEFDSAQQARWNYPDQQYQPPTPTMYFSTDLDEWFEVSLETVAEGYINQAAVGANSVVLMTEIFPEHGILEEGFDEFRSEFVVYVGRPR